MDKTAIGVILMTLAMVCYGIVNPLIKKAGFNTFATMIIQIAVLWFSILPFFIITKSFLNLPSNRSSLLLLVLAGIINAVGYYFLVRSLSLLAVWQVNMFWVLIPLFGGIAGYFLLNEPLTFKFFIGLIFSAFGLFIAFK